MNNPNEPQSAPAGHCPCDFPREVPLHCLTHLVNYIRGEEPLVISDALQHVGCVLGSVGALMGPDPGPQPVGAAPADLSDEQIAKELESYVAAASAPRAAGEEVAAFPQWLIPIIFDVAMRLWREWESK